MAFNKCFSLKSIIIPKSVTRIGSWTFAHCNGLMDVYNYITDLSSVSVEREAFLFDGDCSGRTLYVSQGTSGDYQASPNWYQFFGQIVEGLMTGDVNCDLEVNIADINAVINQILSANYTANGDVNGDGEVNIADVNAIIDIILGN